MARNFYGTVSTLAWIFGHYFYGRKHYTWIAGEYYPYGSTNPKSSNPHLIYQDLYQPWKDRDQFDKFILQTRLNMRTGVIAKENAGDINSTTANSLKIICDKVHINFFYPIVYRVDIDKIPYHRRHVAGSGSTVHSIEYRIDDLVESEFEILFLDFDLRSDPSFKNLIIDEMANPGLNAPSIALSILEKRC